MKTVRYFQIAMVVVGYVTCVGCTYVTGVWESLWLTTPLSTVLIIIGVALMEATQGDN